MIGYAEQVVQPALAWFNNIVHPEDRSVVTETMAAHLEGKTPQSSIECRMRRGTGEYIWVRGLGRVVERTENGAPLRMLGIITDISQQKKTEAELDRAHRTESKLRAELEQVMEAAQTVSHAVASLPKPDVSAVLTTLVLQAQALTGAKYAATGIGTDPEKPFEPWVSVGISPQVVQAPGHAPRPIGVLGEVACEGRIVRVPQVRQHAAFRTLPPGHPEITSFLGIPLRFGGQLLGNLYLANKQGAAEFSSEDERKIEMLATRAAVAVQTARLYASEAEKRAWLGTTIDQIPEGIVLVGRDGRLVTMNRAAGAFICGEPRGLDPYGNPVIFDLRSPNGAPLPFDDYPIVRALRWGEVTLGRQLLVRIADGRMLPILSNAAPVYDERGEIAGATNLVQDITPMKELERLREEWGSVVAHDLRQPVSAIALEVEALLRYMRDDRPDRLQHGLERIQNSVVRLNRMIGDLFSASLLEAHRLPLERQMVDLALLVNGVVDRLRSTVTGHRMEVVAEGKQSAWVDPDRTQQVLENLISNAAKYAQPDSAIRVASVGHDDLVEVTVTNWGPGIQPEELSTLFSRFHRTARARDAQIPGLGLGLYIVKGLVEAQGGRVWAESVPGGATSFLFTLPRNPQQNGGNRMG